MQEPAGHVSDAHRASAAARANASPDRPDAQDPVRASRHAKRGAPPPLWERNTPLNITPLEGHHEGEDEAAGGGREQNRVEAVHHAAVAG